MKKIGYDTRTLPQGKQSSAAVEQHASLKLCIKLTSAVFIPSRSAQKDGQAGRAKDRAQSSTASEGTQSITLRLSEVFPARSDESDILHAFWPSIHGAVQSHMIQVPLYRNILLMQRRADENSLSLEYMALAFLEKMRACFSPIKLYDSNRETKAAGLLKLRIDFSCMVLTGANAFALCPDKDKQNNFIKNPTSDYTSNRTTTYAHFSSRLPKWRNIALIPDPKLFFKKVVRDSFMPTKDESTGTSDTKNDPLHIVFIFHVYKSDTKELACVISFSDIDNPLLPSSEVQIFSCLKLISASTHADPSALLQKYWKDSVQGHLEDTEKRRSGEGLMKKLSRFFRTRSWTGPKDSFVDRIFKWFLLKKQESSTFFVLCVRSSPQLETGQNIVTLKLAEDSGAVVHHLNTQTKVGPCPTESVRKYILIDRPPCIQYRMRAPAQKNSQRRRTAKTTSKPLSKHRSMMHLMHRRNAPSTSSVTMFFQMLRGVDHMALRMSHFLQGFSKNFVWTETSQTMRIASPRIIREVGPTPSVTESPRDTAHTHELNELKAHVYYLTKKVEEHEARESIIAEKEAAIEKWEVRRETLNNSVEELVSLLNNQQRRDEHGGKLRPVLSESLSSRKLRESHDGNSELGLERLTDLPTSRSQATSSDLHHCADECSSQLSTPASIFDAYSEMKPHPPALSPYDGKKSLFMTPRTIDYSEVRLGSAVSLDLTGRRHTEHLTDRTGCSDTHQQSIREENKLLLSKIEVMKVYIESLEAQATHIEATLEPEANTQSPSGGVLVHGNAEHQAIIPVPVVACLQHVQAYVDFLLDSCARARFMSARLKKSLDAQLASMKAQDSYLLENDEKERTDDGKQKGPKVKNGPQVSGATARERTTLTAQSEPGVQLRSAREHIKKLLVKISTKDKESIQWQAKVDKLTRELRVSSGKETNLRNQLDALAQRNQHLMKDFTMFKKNLRKVDKETERIQSQNRLLKDQLEKIETSGAKVYKSVCKAQNGRPVQLVEQQPISARAITFERDDDEQSSYSTALSARTFDEMSCYSMNVSQTSSPVQSAIRPGRLPIPKLPLENVRLDKNLE